MGVDPYRGLGVSNRNENLLSKQGESAMINKTYYLAAILVTAILWASTTGADENKQGKNLYEEKCQLCHGVDGKGDGPAAVALTKQPKDFNSRDFWTPDVDKKIADTVRNGHSPMPAFDLTDEEIKAITDYMTQKFKQ